MKMLRNDGPLLQVNVCHHCLLSTYDPALYQISNTFLLHLVPTEFLNSCDISHKVLPLGMESEFQPTLRRLRGQDSPVQWGHFQFHTVSESVEQIYGAPARHPSATADKPSKTFAPTTANAIVR